MKALIINELEKIIKSKIGYVFLLSAGLLIWMNITMYDPKEGVWNIDSFYTFPASLLDIYTVSYTHLTLPTKPMMCRSRWSPYH